MTYNMFHVQFNNVSHKIALIRYFRNELLVGGLISSKNAVEQGFYIHMGHIGVFMQKLETLLNIANTGDTSPIDSGVNAFSKASVSITVVKAPSIPVIMNP